MGRRSIALQAEIPSRHDPLRGSSGRVPLNHTAVLIGCHETVGHWGRLGSAVLEGASSATPAEGQDGAPFETAPGVRDPGFPLFACEVSSMPFGLAIQVPASLAVQACACRLARRQSPPVNQELSKVPTYSPSLVLYAKSCPTDPSMLLQKCVCT